MTESGSVAVSQLHSRYRKHAVFGLRAFGRPKHLHDMADYRSAGEGGVFSGSRVVAYVSQYGAIGARTTGSQIDESGSNLVEAKSGIRDKQIEIRDSHRVLPHPKAFESP